ncbi:MULTISPECIES: TetR/AcrR family transcriptional regulator [Ferrimonas]|uniref:TetR/AcrR family transcriptional regulator n=1 Tax=Ferrimonas TaxID=44011 RepID=UPI00041C914B|nr:MULTISPECIES: TetR/AcrR family transcriptional regulator [Ferrimonas]USD37666.1 TetR/AcrR family transcriptional regulator [Ferrimonas sp. SCSIO 43195]
MSKSDLYKVRETRILLAALNTASSKGALDFRMADVARAAECSVGTLYGHFISKEDMMAALVQVGLGRRSEFAKKVNAIELSGLERFVSLLVLEQQRLAHDDILAQLELLVCYSDLWRRAADKRVAALRDASEEFDQQLDAALVEADGEGFRISDEQRARLIARGRAAVLGAQLQTSRQTLVPCGVMTNDGEFYNVLADIVRCANGPALEGSEWLQKCQGALELGRELIEQPVFGLDAA